MVPKIHVAHLPSAIIHNKIKQNIECRHDASSYKSSRTRNQRNLSCTIRGSARAIQPAARLPNCFSVAAFLVLAFFISALLRHGEPNGFQQQFYATPSAVRSSSQQVRNVAFRCRKIVEFTHGRFEFDVIVQ